MAVTGADLSEKLWFCLNYFSEFTPPEAVTQTCMWSQGVFLTVNHHGPVPLRELHSTDDKRSSVERPWGILSPFSTRFRLQVNSSFQGLFVTQTYYYVASLWSRSFFLRWITADPSCIIFTTKWGYKIKKHWLGCFQDWPITRRLD